MPDLDIEPHQYRRKGTYRLRDLGRLVELGVARHLGSVSGGRGGCHFSTRPAVGFWGFVLAPCIALGASTEHGTAEDVSRD